MSLRDELDESGSEAPVTPEAIRVLVDSHNRFLNFLERRVGSRSEAEDILQGAFVRGPEKAATIRDDDSVVAWFFRVLHNAVTDHHRRRAARERLGDRLALEESESTESPEIHQAVCRCVSGLLGTLKPEYGSLLERVELEEQSVVDAARDLGITANNAAVRLHRARQALRRRVIQACGACAEHGCLDCHCKHGV